MLRLVAVRLEVLHPIPVGHQKAGEVGDMEFWLLHARPT
jgi:hypothetical protein